jgi:hypothetical protein
MGECFWGNGCERHRKQAVANLGNVAFPLVAVAFLVTVFV